MNFNTDTYRLQLKNLTLHHAPFILELLNTEGWKTFIGERYIHTILDARAYIQRINGNPDIKYYVVYLKDTASPIGMISLIQRAYLPDRDIGYAFLPRYTGNGYALEAAKCVLDGLIAHTKQPVLYATTFPHNVASVRLLEKLGLRLKEELQREQEGKLLLYEVDLEAIRQQQK
ncbi:GNAT family N-acetyltransferase [Chitinophaga sp. sic0106]|uniref:GNAT family N-acetyltransferase n=1 Tax=Chitinophaga sp. sic0106 TaxID=2854785 RepID=UPI001C48129D|nr:GNAT family N-acetyltransferase [Chitinophaga sp. sic0106]MBV7533145.1 GNAT family N-acetyltransferase [Chitinophaga sp. sic0106]